MTQEVPMKSSLAHAVESNEKQSTIIQCPDCQTKFAVETEVILKCEIPRFHCSRCDHIFTLEWEEVSPGIQSQPKPQVTPTTIERESGSVDATPIPQITPPAEDQFTFDFDRVAEDSSFSFGEMDNKLSVSTKEFSVSVVDDDFDPVSTESLKPDILGGLPKEFTTASQKLGRDEPMGYSSFARPQVGVGITNTFSESPQSYDDLVSNNQSEVLRKISGKSIRSILMEPSLIGALFGPILGFLCVLAIATFLIISSPSIAKSTANALGADGDMAPTELLITKSTVKRVALENGDMATVLSGVIANDSNRDFSDVKIEGLLYDSAGNLLTSKRISASASLGRSRIQSLTSEMINELQNAKPIKKFELKGGQRYEFTMAIPEAAKITKADPQFFALRLYSAKGSDL